MSEFERKITRVTIEKGRVVINGNTADASQEADMRKRMDEERQVWDVMREKPRRLPSFFRGKRKLSV